MVPHFANPLLISVQPVSLPVLIEAIEGLADAFALYDVQDRLVFCNDGYRHIFGDKAPPNLIGMTFERIAQHCLEHGLYPDAVGREDCYLEERLANHYADIGTIEQTLQDGRVERIMEHLLPSGYRVGLHSIVTDLAEARRVADNANRAKSRFFATMSHEIRTPLVGILGMVDLLLEAQADLDSRPMLRIVQQSGETLLRIVNDVLDMAKIESGKMQLSLAAFDPGTLIAPIIERYTVIALKKGLRIKFQVNADGPLARVGDDLRFGQIVDNLLGNSMKFTEKGEVRLTLENRAGQPLRLIVEDTGIGMSPDQVDRVLLPFEQADDSSTRRFGGTGLGLSIVRYICDSLGGTMKIDSALGVGTRLTLSLPLAESHVPVVPVQVVPKETTRELVGKRILVADDNDINRAILSGFLAKIGAVTTLVEDGNQAITAACEGNFDLICLDVSMPVKDGVDAMHEIRAKFGAKCPPIVAVTAHAMDHQVAEYQAAGFDAHLGKPFHRNELEALLRRLLV